MLFTIGLVSEARTQVTYTAGPTNAQINAVFSGSPNVTISGGSLVAGNRSQQIATFSGGTAAGLEMNSGIFFGTGNVANLLKTNTVHQNSDNPGGSTTYSDPHLTTLNANTVNAKYDPVVYTFNVTMSSKSSKLNISYQFGSEEYPVYVGSPYNDAFGFFISGPGISGTQNIAKLPGSGNITSINTVNIGRKGHNACNYPAISGVDLTQSALFSRY